MRSRLVAVEDVEREARSAGLSLEQYLGTRELDLLENGMAFLQEKKDISLPAKVFGSKLVKRKQDS